MTRTCLGIGLLNGLLAGSSYIYIRRSALMNSGPRLVTGSKRLRATVKDNTVSVSTINGVSVFVGRTEMFLMLKSWTTTEV